MASGLNKKFLSDPLDFLKKNLMSIVDGNMKLGKNLVGFYADQERILLKQFIGPVGKYQHPFECYFLPALPNQDNIGTNFASSKEQYFFTSTLSGCQFLAYGKSRNSLTIEHNYDLTGTGKYASHFKEIPTFEVSARVHNGGLYDITKDDVGNVVGIRKKDGWKFYFQKIERNKKSLLKTITVTNLF